jgi:hypothetical protein
MNMPEFDKLGQQGRRADTSRIMLLALFARIDTVALTLAAGAVIGLVMFLATAVLLLQGAPPDWAIGANLSALTTFMPGFEVSWIGGLAGAVYGFIVGSALGFVLAVAWNFTHLLFVGFAAIKGNWLVD